MRSYHSHITIPHDLKFISTAMNVIGGKQTVIDLATQGEVSTDCMITNYYKNKMDINDVIVEYMNNVDRVINANIPVIRYKLELEYKSIDEMDDHCGVRGQYIEQHFKCVIPKVAKLETLKSNARAHGLMPSTNPLNVRPTHIVQFFNKRYKIEDDFVSVVRKDTALMGELIQSFGFIDEIKTELVAHDSNMEHDAWWCKV